MDQSIKIKIAGKEYPLRASSPEKEQLMRLAAEDINKMLATYDDKYPNYDLVDKLAFVALNETFSRFRYQKQLSLVKEEADGLNAELDAYLKGIDK